MSALPSPTSSPDRIIMRKLAPLALAPLVVLAAACSPEAESPAPVADTVSVPTDTGGTSQSSIDTVYLAVLDRQGVDYPSETEALIAAQAICSTLDQGFDLRSILIGAVTESEPIFAGFDNADIGSISGAAISAFCPEFESQIDALGGAQ